VAGSHLTKERENMCFFVNALGRKKVGEAEIDEN
jgi:hypothetical protein